MKLLDTIKKLVQEAEDAYYEAVEKFADEKTVNLLEKQYEDSLKLMEMYERMKKVKNKV